jgi:hypothetical protein
MMKFLKRLVQLAAAFIFAYALFEQWSREPKERTWQGNAFGVPYDFRPPTPERFMQRWWNPKDERVLTPHFFGVGWSINLYQLNRRFQELVG